MTDITEQDKAKIAEWALSGDTGISSKNLARQALGLPIENVGRFYVSPPADPLDLGRCLRLIAIVPAVRQCVDELAAVNENWAKAAKVWDEISESMAREVGIDWSKGKSAPITYGKMKEAGL